MSQNLPFNRCQTMYQIDPSTTLHSYCHHPTSGHCHLLPEFLQPTFNWSLCLQSCLSPICCSSYRQKNLSKYTSYCISSVLKTHTYHPSNGLVNASLIYFIYNGVHSLGPLENSSICCSVAANSSQFCPSLGLSLS